MTSSPQNGPAPTRTSAARRRRRRWWIIGASAVVLALGGSFVAVAALRPPEVTLTASDLTVLAPDTIRDTIATTGTVASARTYKVYSSLPYAVDRIAVSVGQVVEEGDLLGRLSTTTLDKQIDTSLASIEQSAGTSDAAIQTAEDRYNASRTALANGNSASLASADAAVSSAKSAWRKAHKAYNDYAENLSEGENTQVLAQKAALGTAEDALASAEHAADLAADDLAAAEQAQTEAEQAYAAAQAVVDDAGAGVTQAQLDALEAAETALEAAEDAVGTYTRVATSTELSLDAATTAYDSAEAQYEAILTATDDALGDYKLAADAARTAYLKALNSQDAAEASAQTEVQLNLDALRSSQASASNLVQSQDLSNLRQDRRATAIRAPMSGTVTAVYAVVGANAAGPAFVVERLDELVIDSSVKEYDVVSVEPGLAATIESDATRGAVYEGRVTSVAPASEKDPSGDTITGSDIQYATSIEVTSADTDLRIGMNVRVNLVLAEEGGVLVVPYEAVYTNAWGSRAVLAAVEAAEGTYELTEFAVTTGLENDFSVAISGNGVEEGLRVLNVAEGRTAGTIVRIAG